MKKLNSKSLINKILVNKPNKIDKNTQTNREYNLNKILKIKLKIFKKPFLL